MTLSEFDPFSPEFLRAPYEGYKRLRDESPCHYVPSRAMWILSRYEDVVAAAKNHAVFSSTGGVGFDWEQRPMMPMYDPPVHTRHRRLVSRSFQPGAVAKRAASVEAMVAQLTRPLLEGATVDLVSEIAVPLSLGVIADLIGVPEDKRSDLRRWSMGVVEELAGGLDASAEARVEALRRDFIGFLRTLVAERRANPDAAATDVISTILAAQDEDHLTERETLAFCVLLLVAGFETTVNAIANGVLALVENPGEWRKVRATPTLLPSLAEEIVRYDGPVQSFFRNTLSEVTIAGQTIPQGVKVQLLFGSANRDERKYADPDAFRADRQAPDHTGYGVGVHYCLGAPLARMQITSVFGALAPKVARFELAGDVTRFNSVLFRGARKLPLRVVRD